MKHIRFPHLRTLLAAAAFGAAVTTAQSALVITKLEVLNGETGEPVAENEVYELVSRGTPLQFLATIADKSGMMINSLSWEDIVVTGQPTFQFRFRYRYGEDSPGNNAPSGGSAVFSMLDGNDAGEPVLYFDYKPGTADYYTAPFIPSGTAPIGLQGASIATTDNLSRMGTGRSAQLADTALLDAFATAAAGVSVNVYKIQSEFAVSGLEAETGATATFTVSRASGDDPSQFPQPALTLMATTADRTVALVTGQNGRTASEAIAATGSSATFVVTGQGVGETTIRVQVSGRPLEYVDIPVTVTRGANDTSSAVSFDVPYLALSESSGSRIIQIQLGSTATSNTTFTISGYTGPEFTYPESVLIRAGSRYGDITIKTGDGLAGSTTRQLVFTPDNPQFSEGVLSVLVTNQPPRILSATHEKESIVGKEVTFRANATDVETDAGTLRYHWDFGDGATSDSATATHVYQTEGDYAVTLTVTDKDGGVSRWPADEEEEELITITDGVLLICTSGTAGLGGAWASLVRRGGVGPADFSFVNPVATWDPVKGNRFKPNQGVLVQSTVSEPHCYRFAWFDDPASGILTGANSDAAPSTIPQVAISLPSSGSATLRYLSSRAYSNDVTAVLGYLDDFGDFDQDALSDTWESAYFDKNLGTSGELLASGFAVADWGNNNIDYGPNGNMDSDYLPTSQTMIWQVPDEDPTPAGAHFVQVFQYPLSFANANASYNTLSEAIAENPERRTLSNLIEFRGLFESYDFPTKTETNTVDEADGTVTTNIVSEADWDRSGEAHWYRYAPELVSDGTTAYERGNCPGTDPTKTDSDEDGFDDGWEYYFWSTVLYEVNADQWRAYDPRLAWYGWDRGDFGIPLLKKDPAASPTNTASSIEMEPIGPEQGPDYDALVKANQRAATIFYAGTFENLPVISVSVTWTNRVDGTDGETRAFGSVADLTYEGLIRIVEQSTGAQVGLCNPNTGELQLFADGVVTPLTGTVTATELSHPGVFLKDDLIRLFDPIRIPPVAHGYDNAVKEAGYDSDLWDGASDPDNDGLTIMEEYMIGSDPLHWDTDRDGMPDGWEVLMGLLPLDPRNKVNLCGPGDNPDRDFMAVDLSGEHEHAYAYIYSCTMGQWWDGGFHPGFVPGVGAFPMAKFGSIAFGNRAEFLVARYYKNLEQDFVGAPDVQIYPTAWGEYSTNPLSDDTDENGMPDGWSLYVGWNPIAGGPGKFVRDLPLNYILWGEPPMPIGDEDQDGLVVGDEFACWDYANSHASEVLVPVGSGSNAVVHAAVLIPPQSWTNKLKPTDPWQADTDHDGVMDYSEVGPSEYVYNLNPGSVDTDRDWLPDDFEVQSWGQTEPVNLLLAQSQSLLPNTPPTGVGLLDPYGPYGDPDGDGLPNYQEYLTAAVYGWRYDQWYSLTNKVLRFWPADWPKPIPGVDPEVDQSMFFPPSYSYLTGALFYDPANFFLPAPSTLQFDQLYTTLDTLERRFGMTEAESPWMGAGPGPLGRWSYQGIFNRLFAVLSNANFPPEVTNNWWITETEFNAIQDFYFGSYLQGYAVNCGRAAWPWDPAAKANGLGSPYCYIHRNGRQVWPGTLGLVADSDSDGMDDYWEIYHGLNPTYGGARMPDGADSGSPLATSSAAGAEVNSDRADKNPYGDGVTTDDWLMESNPTFVRNLEYVPLVGWMPVARHARVYPSQDWCDYLDVVDPFGAPHEKYDPDNYYSFDDGEKTSFFAMGSYFEPWAHFDGYNRPWLAGDRAADPDHDGLNNKEESYGFLANDILHHTDPSPYWMTDPMNPWSHVSLYYGPGTFADNALWWWDTYATDMLYGNSPPAFIFDFEINEGFDTDNDNISDREELTFTEDRGVTDPLDFDSPVARKALYFDGNAAARTRNPVFHDKWSLTSYTVEFWFRAEDPAAGHPQVLVDRPVFMPVDDPDRAVAWAVRHNFLVLLDENGRLKAQVDNDAIETAGASATILSQEPIPPNRWTHVAVVMDSVGDTFSLYIDGNPSGSVQCQLKPCTGLLLANEWRKYTTEEQEALVEQYIVDSFSPAPLVLGASDANPWGIVSGLEGTQPDFEPDKFFKGWIDEVRVWDGARTLSQIHNNMTKRFSGADVEKVNRPRYAWNLANLGNATALSDFPQQILYHFSFDNLPDTGAVPAEREDALAALRAKSGQEGFMHQDFDPVPAGWAAVADAIWPKTDLVSDDLSAQPNWWWSNYGIPWWFWAEARSAAYGADYRYLPVIENTAAHLALYPPLDMPSVVPVYGTDYTPAEYRHRRSQDWILETEYSVLRYGKEVKLTMSGDILDGLYVTAAAAGDSATAVNETVDGEESSEVATEGAAGDGTGAGGTLVVSGSTNTNGVTTAAEAPTSPEPTYPLDFVKNAKNPYGTHFSAGVTYALSFSPVNFGGKLNAYGTFDTVPIATDLLPLLDAVADVDVEMWDGNGAGYDYEALDSDGDGLPDWWEIAHGLSPNSGDGLAGAYGDADGDGLDNYAEYLAGTDPFNAYTHGQGYSDYYWRDDDHSLTYGELYDDGDGMDNQWELRYGLDPERYDAHEDSDGDGWTNGEEFMAQTDPARADSYPIPSLNVKYYYDGKYDEQGELYAMSWSERRSTYGYEGDDWYGGTIFGTNNWGGAPNGKFWSHVSELGEWGSAGTETLKFNGVSESYSVANLGSTDIDTTVPPVLTVYSSASIAMFNAELTSSLWDVDDNYLVFNDAQGGRILLDYRYGKLYGQGVSGQFKLDFQVKPRSYPATISGMSRVDGSLVREHMLGGYNRFFGWLDLDGDGVYSVGEPAGISRHRPTLVGWDAVDVEIPLTDDLWGFPRVSWIDTEPYGIKPDFYAVTFAYNVGSVSNLTSAVASDPDLDGLDEWAEDKAGTDPVDPDTGDTGYSDYFKQDADGRTFGEKYDDGDGIPNAWERERGLDPDRFDRNDDMDADGWPNWEEYMANANPNDASQFPVPTMDVTFDYAGVVSNMARLVVYSWAERNATAGVWGGDPDGIFMNVEGISYGSTTVDGTQTARIGGYDRYVRFFQGYQVASATFTYQETQNGSNTTVTVEVPHSNDEYGWFSNESGTGVFGIQWETGTVFAEGSFIGTPFQLSVVVDGYNFPFTEQGLLRTKGTRLHAGWNRFFGFTDVNGNGEYDVGEPAGLSIRRPSYVSFDTMSATIPLSDGLFGYPRFSWPTNYVSENTYSTVTIWRDSATGSGSGAQVATLRIPKPRNFVHEGDLLAAGLNGLPFGNVQNATFRWYVFDGADTTSARARQIWPVPGDAEADNRITYSYVGTSSEDNDYGYSVQADNGRRTMQAIYPRDGETVHGPLVDFKWKMDHRTEGARFTVRNKATGAVLLNNVIVPLPWGHGEKADGSKSSAFPSYYSAAPQLENGKTLVSLPEGEYEYTITEYVNATGFAAQSVTGSFVLENSDEGRNCHAISGNLYYWGRVQDGVSSGNPTFPANVVVQAFQVTDRASNAAAPSGNPVAQAVLTKQGEFSIHGLKDGTYALWAFLDSDSDGVADDWETQGYGVYRGSASPVFYGSPSPFVVTNADVDDVSIVLHDRDTDNDKLPDAWEWKKWGTLAAHSGTENGGQYLTEYASLPIGAPAGTPFFFPPGSEGGLASLELTVTPETYYNTFYVKAPRTFLHEGDFEDAGFFGFPLGAETNTVVQWQALAYSSYYIYLVGSGEENISAGPRRDRKAMRLRYPDQLTVVVGDNVDFEWEMDWRNAGVLFTLERIDEYGRTVDADGNLTTDRSKFAIFDRKILPFPVRRGKTGDSDYWFTACPQMENGAGHVELPVGSYRYTITERPMTDAYPAQSVTGHFQVVADNPTDGRYLHSLSGTIQYFGKVQGGLATNSVAEIVELGTLGTLDGASREFETAFSGFDVAPGATAILVKDPDGNVLDRFNDAVGRVAGEGVLFPESPVYGWSGSIDYPAEVGGDGYVRLVFDAKKDPPPAGCTVVLARKAFKTNLIVQAFRLPDNATTSASVSGAPVAELRLSAKGPWGFDGLRQGNYAVRAFVDSNGNGAADAWETQGVAVLGGTVSPNLSPETGVISLVSDVKNLLIVLHDRDTDNDRLPDAWEWQMWGSVEAHSGWHASGADGMLYLWQEYADGPLDSDPRTPDTDLDGLTDALEIMVTGTDTHAKDTDGDGLGDLEEFLSGSDPLDAASAVAYRTPALAFDDAGVPFVECPYPALPRGVVLTYTLQRKESLSDAEWTDVDDLVVAATNATQVAVADGVVAYGAPAGVGRMAPRDRLGPAEWTSGFFRVRVDADYGKMVDNGDGTCSYWTWVNDGAGAAWRWAEAARGTGSLVRDAEGNWSFVSGETGRPGSLVRHADGTWTFNGGDAEVAAPAAPAATGNVRSAGAAASGGATAGALTGLVPGRLVENDDGSLSWWTWNEETEGGSKVWTEAARGVGLLQLRSDGTWGFVPVDPASSGSTTWRFAPVSTRL